jgi:hypothetical protein
MTHMMLNVPLWIEQLPTQLIFICRKHDKWLDRFVLALLTLRITLDISLILQLIERGSCLLYFTRW